MDTSTQTTDNNLIVRSEPNNNNNPYPTTFVQADTSSFKQVVQMLTGKSEPPGRHQNNLNKLGPRRSSDKPSPKLFERRNSFKNFKISPLAPGPATIRPGYLGSPRPGTPELLSPSLLNFPSLTLSSPVTPLDSEAAEARAIREKGFYLHPSPANTPKKEAAEPPRLLPLFPVTSPPEVMGRSTSAAANC